jgi:hypothetical protein
MSATENKFLAIYLANPFEPKEQTRELIDWEAEKTLSDYFPDVDGITEVISINGKLIEARDFPVTYLSADDSVVICSMPMGGGGDNKSVLRIVAMIAIAVAAGPAAVGILGTGSAYLGVAGLGITMAGGMLVNALLPPPKRDAEQSSPSYGIDGAKTTSSEGIPVPVLYGNFLTGGNILNTYVTNEGLNQYLHMLVAVSEGPINAINQVYLNEQPIQYYTSEYLYYNGSAEQTIPRWFDDTITPFYLGQTITENYLTYNTNIAVDRVRIDLNFPVGLVLIDDRGRSYSTQVDIEVQARAWGSSDAWVSYGSSSLLPPTLTGYTVYNFSDVTVGSAGDGGTYTERQITSQTTVKTFAEVQAIHADAVVIENKIYQSASVALEVGVLLYEPQYSTVFQFVDSIKQPFRRSLDISLPITQRYEFRVRRLNVDNQLDTILNTVVLTDFNEITTEDINYRYTALVALRVKLTDQLNSIPNITINGNGRFCPVYNAATDKYEQTYTNNVAWIALDMMTNTRYGLGISYNRIDLDMVKEWAQFCLDNNLTFDGIFDTVQTGWDALQTVARAGRATALQVGTRYTFAIERADTPVMMFTVANIKKGSFKQNWLPMTERVNEIEITFNDKDNGFKPRTIRVADSTAAARGTPQRSTSMTLVGVTDNARANREAVLRLNLNKYVTQTVSFEAPIEAIACYVGSLIYVQHDMPQWGFGGRLKAGSTTSSLVLDRPMTMVAGKSYMALVMYTALARHTGTIASITGNLLILNGYTAGAFNDRRLTVGTIDREITRSSGNGVWLDSVAGLNVGDTYQVWETDAIEERGVVTTTGQGVHNLLLGSEYIVPGVFGWNKGPNLTYNGQIGTLAGYPAFQFTSVAASNSYIEQIIGGFLPGEVVTVSYLCSTDQGTSWAVCGATQFGVLDKTLVQAGVWRWRFLVTVPSGQTTITVHAGVIDASNGTVWSTTAAQLNYGASVIEYVKTEGAAVRQTATTLTLQSPLSLAPPVFTNFMFGEVGRVKKPFRVRSISGGTELTREITALEYNSSVYTESPTPTPDYSALQAGPVAPVIVGVSEELVSAGAGFIVRATVTYVQQGDFPGGCRVHVSRNGQAWEDLGYSTDRATVISQDGEVLTFLVQAYDVTGGAFPWASSPQITHTVVGKAAPPGDVQNLQVTLDSTTVRATWDAVTDIDIIGYELRTGVSWDQGAVLATRYQGTSYEFKNSLLQGTLLMIRALDSSSVYSTNVTSFVLDAYAPPDIENFAAVQNGSRIEMSWRRASINEQFQYEIREGTDWLSSTLLGIVDVTFFSVPVYGRKGSRTFLARSRAASNGALSSTTVSATITVVDTLDRNVILSKEEHSLLWPGIKNNVRAEGSTLLLPAANLEGDYITPVTLSESMRVGAAVFASVTGVVENTETWEQAVYSWEDQRAEKSWVTSVDTSSITVEHQIATAAPLPSSVIEAFTLNTKTEGELGTTAATAVSVAYGSGRFGAGYSLQDGSSLSYNVLVPAQFSQTQWFRPVSLPPGRYPILRMNGPSSRVLKAHNIIRTDGTAKIVFGEEVTSSLNELAESEKFNASPWETTNAILNPLAPPSGSSFAYSLIAANPDTPTKSLSASGLIDAIAKTTVAGIESKNLVRNPTFNGAVVGTPGTSPTSHLIAYTATGLASQIIGTGTIEGLRYIDVRIHGTVTVAGYFVFFFDNDGNWAANGQEVTAGVNHQRIAGTSLNVSGSRISIVEQNSLGAYITQGDLFVPAPTTAPLSSQRFSFNRTLSGSNVVKARHYWYTNVAVGEVDITYRFAAPEFRLNSTIQLPGSYGWDDHNRLINSRTTVYAGNAAGGQSNIQSVDAVPARLYSDTIVQKGTRGTGGDTNIVAISATRPIGTLMTISCSVWIPSSTTLTSLSIAEDSTLGSGPTASFVLADVSLRDQWQRISVTGVAAAATQYGVLRLVAGSGAVVYHTAWNESAGLSTNYVSTGASAVGSTEPGWLIPGATGSRISSNARSSIAWERTKAEALSPPVHTTQPIIAGSPTLSGKVWTLGAGSGVRYQPYADLPQGYRKYRVTFTILSVTGGVIIDWCDSSAEVITTPGTYVRDYSTFPYGVGTRFFDIQTGAGQSATVRFDSMQEVVAPAGGWVPATHNLMPGSLRLASGNGWSVGPNTRENGLDGLLNGFPAYSFTAINSVGNSYLGKALSVTVGQEYTVRFWASISGGGWVSMGITNRQVQYNRREIGPGLWEYTAHFVPAPTETSVFILVGVTDPTVGTTWRTSAPQMVHGMYIGKHLPTHAQAALYGPAIDYLSVNALSSRASPGTGAYTANGVVVPLHWIPSSVTGVAMTKVGEGIIGDMRYTDIRWAGTATQSGGCNMYFDDLAVSLPALTGEQLTASVFVQVLAGSSTGFSNAGMVLDAHTLDGTYITSDLVWTGLPTTVDFRDQRAVATITTSGGANQRHVRPVYHMQISNGAVVDITLRISTPMLHRGAVAHPVDATFGADYEIRSEETRTNNIRNSGAKGAVVGGAFPDNWFFYQGVSGLSASVVGVSTLLGLPAVDIRIQGTHASANNAGLNFNGGITGASNGQTRTLSVYYQRIAGSNAGIDLFAPYYNELTSAGAYVTGGRSASANPTTSVQRASYTRTLSGGGTVARVEPFVLFDTTPGQAIDITLRIACPQEELGHFDSSPILGFGTATTRAEDFVSADVSQWGIAGTGTIRSTFRAGALGPVNNFVACLDDGTNTERLILIRSLDAGKGRFFATNDSVTLGTDADTTTTSPKDAMSTIAGSWAVNNLIQSMNGSSDTPDTTASAMPTVTRLVFGNQSAGARALNGGVRSFDYYPVQHGQSLLSKLSARSSIDMMASTLVTVGSTSYRNFSTRLRYRDSTYAALVVYNVTTSAVVAYARLNLITGAVTPVVGAGAATIDTEGWYRFSVTTNAAVTSGNVLSVRILVGDGLTNSVSGKSVDATAAQVVAGTDVTSYVVAPVFIGANEIDYELEQNSIILIGMAQGPETRSLIIGKSGKPTSARSIVAEPIGSITSISFNT